MANAQQAKQVLYKAMELDRPIDIPFPTKEGAIAFRFMLYGARKRERKEGADHHGVALSDFKSNFDKLHFSLEELDDGRWAVRIQPVCILDLEIIDTFTGEQLEMKFTTTAEDVAAREPEVPLGVGNIKPDYLE